MKKVTLFINSLTKGGAERVISIITTELVAQQIEVDLLCIEKDLSYPLPKEVNVIYLSSLTKHDSALKKLLYIPYLGYKLKRHVRKHKVELIQSHINRANFTNIVAKLFGSTHQVQVVEVSSIHNLKTRSFSKKINYFLIKLLYKHADMVIFKAERMKEEFLKKIPNIKKYTVINNPYDIQKITFLVKETIDDFKFSKEKKYIISVGRLTYKKRLTTLLSVLKELNNNIELIIIGEGEEKTNLRKYILSNNLEKRVHLLGEKDNPFKYVRQANLFILASEEEGFPNVLVEAMICSTPIISTDCLSGPREILAPDTDINFQLKLDLELAKNGILYPVDNEEKLKSAIEIMLNDEVKQKEYISNGLKQSQEYTLEKIIKKYKKVLSMK